MQARNLARLATLRQVAPPPLVRLPFACFDPQIASFASPSVNGFVAKVLERYLDFEHTRVETREKDETANKASLRITNRYRSLHLRNASLLS